MAGFDIVAAQLASLWDLLPTATLGAESMRPGSEGVTSAWSPGGGVTGPAPADGAVNELFDHLTDGPKAVKQSDGSPGKGQGATGPGSKLQGIVESAIAAVPEKKRNEPQWDFKAKVDPEHMLFGDVMRMPAGMGGQIVVTMRLTSVATGVIVKAGKGVAKDLSDAVATAVAAIESR